MTHRQGRRCSILVPIVGAMAALLGFSAAETGHNRAAWALAALSALAAGASAWAALKLLVSYALR